MEKISTNWYSRHLNEHILVARYGHFGQPVLLFPTAGGDAEECERFLMIDVLRPLIDAGRIKIYSIDSVAGRAWIDDRSSGVHRAWKQNRFDAFIYDELVPAIHRDCQDSTIPIWTAGASIGAFNALAAICRHPDVFERAFCMSGTYDLSRWMKGQHTLDFHYSSPLHFLPGMPEGEHLRLLRTRHIMLATGEGRWEDPSGSWRVANMLGALGIPNYVDLWGKSYDHDWITWREMLPMYLEKYTAT